MTNCFAWTCNVCQRTWISVISPIHHCADCGNTTGRERNRRYQLTQNRKRKQLRAQVAAMKKEKA